MDDKRPIFRKEYQDYTRDFNYEKQYIEQCLTYAKIQNPNVDEVKFTEWLKDNMREEGLFPVHNPRMLMNIKDKNNDRQRSVIDLKTYLRTIQRNELRFAPTFTTYMPEHVLKSPESSFLTDGMSARKKEKKLKFQAKERGDDLMVEYHDNMQQMLKVLNNSSSGAKAPEGTILYNSTGHSTLTSICRSETSFANSINEKFLGGYRHYFNPDITIHNIVATLTWVDIPRIEQVMNKYQLHYVTPDELIEMIRRSTDLYWKAPKHFQKIIDFVKKLTPLQCSAYLYNGDLYALRRYNETFVREWLTKLINVDDLTPVPETEIDYWLGKMDADIDALVAVYLATYCDGVSIGKAMSENPSIRGLVAATVKNTVSCFEMYHDLIDVFWVTDVLPFETARLPEMMRGVVLGSDTDSSLFSVDVFWVNWYLGKAEHNSIASKIEATVVYLTTQHIAHTLGAMTGILGIHVDKRDIIAMKNEFMFSSFTTTSAGKHYFAKKEAQEGIMIRKDKMETEIKGVRLKHTKVPREITNIFKQQLYDIMNLIERDEKLSLIELTRNIAELEHRIYESIKRGESTYLQRAKVKVKDAYQNENSIYKRGHVLWEAVFADKYGHAMDPPYDAIKISTAISSKRKLQNWLEQMPDKNIAEKLKRWIDEENNGNPLETFYIPKAVVSGTGIPDELLMVCQPRKLVFTTVNPYYLLLESFGYFLQNNHLTRLVSDDFEEYRIPESIFDNDD